MKIGKKGGQMDIRKMSTVKYTLAVLVKESVFADLQIIFNLKKQELYFLIALHVAVMDKHKGFVVTWRDLHPFMLQQTRRLHRNIMIKGINRLVELGYLEFIGNKPYEMGTKGKVMSQFRVVKPKLDYFVGIFQALLRQKYNNYQKITNYKIETNMTILTKKDVVKHKRNMLVLKKMK